MYHLKKNLFSTGIHEEKDVKRDDWSGKEYYLLGILGV